MVASVEVAEEVAWMLRESSSVRPLPFHGAFSQPMLLMADAVVVAAVVDVVVVSN